MVSEKKFISHSAKVIGWQVSIEPIAYLTTSDITECEWMCSILTECKTYNIAFDVNIDTVQHKKLCQLLGYDDIHFTVQVCERKRDSYIVEMSSFQKQYYFEMNLNDWLSLIFVSKTFGAYPLMFTFLNRNRIAELLCKFAGKIRIPIEYQQKQMKGKKVQICGELRIHYKTTKYPAFRACKWQNDLLGGCKASLDVRGFIAAAYCANPNTVKDILCLKENAYSFQDGCYVKLKYGRRVSISRAREECQKINSTQFYFSNDEYEFFSQITTGDNRHVGIVKKNIAGKLKIVKDVNEREIFVYDDRKPYEFYAFIFEQQSKYLGECLTIQETLNANNNFHIGNEERCYYLEKVFQFYPVKYTVIPNNCNLNVITETFCKLPYDYGFSLVNRLKNVQFNGCPDHFYHCTMDNICIHSINVCDGTDDCISDGEDEKNCGNIQLFYCDVSSTIAFQLVCDSVYDCPNKLDEVNCETKQCRMNETRCDNMQCIDDGYVCNRERNCFDESDEKCSQERLFDYDYDCLQYDRFKCDRKCLSKEILCNKQWDCLDGRDEKESICAKENAIPPEICKSVENLKSNSCEVVYTSMGNLLTRVHFPYSSLENCNRKSCEMGKYLCNKVGYCISIKQICDGIVHCVYHDDEFDCG
ncbi:DgyrCDS14519 [Dimorphilus gyrociliatus]|uniref:DgyrCDS14519 n=1 Tax=Dimorphilus gyrociliatus TaxID=2664684 RepID=A0A7I8WDX5_9ANNE|nr:DgyrCDS14519 [Dimorphilus gyrociliatus]